MATGNFGALPIPWNDSLGAFGIAALSGATFTGSVGIGGAPAAMPAASHLQLGARSHVFELNSNGNLYLTSNAYFNGTSWIYETSSRPSFNVAFNGTDGAFVLNTAPAGTAGAAMTFSEVARISAAGLLTLASGGQFAGAVGIGAAATYSLDVQRADASIRIAPSTTTNNALLRLTNSGNAFVGLDSSAGALSGVAYSLNLFRSGSFPVILSTNDTERMRIEASGGIVESQPHRFAQFTLSTLPSASAFNGYFIDVTNAAGGPKLCRSNGTVWQLVNTTTTVS